MPSAEKLQRSTDNKRAHALARIETRNGVDPADVDITERIFTSEEEENLPESMCDGHVAGRERGARGTARRRAAARLARRLWLQHACQAGIGIMRSMALSSGSAW